MKKDKDGKTIYEKYPPNFDAGGVLNVGSCVANSHITGAAMKVANIFATLPLRGNYEVIADYILNRVGAVAWPGELILRRRHLSLLAVIAWVSPWWLGRIRQNIVGCLSAARKKMTGRYGWQREKAGEYEEPSPEHLITVVESKERAIITMAKLCIRKNDTPQGRQLKLTHYISLHKQYMGTLPDDLHLFIRKASDIPIFYKKEVMPYLEKVGWKEKPVLTLPTLIGTYPSEVPIEAVVH